MKHRLLALFVSLLFGAAVATAQQTSVTIAAVNNPDMLELKKLSSKFLEQNPSISLNWVIAEENILRQRITTDISTGSGQFDLVFLGLYEAPIFAKRGWLRPIGELPADYDIEDVFKSLRDGFSYDGKLVALPFYGESSFLIYRKDLFEQKIKLTGLASATLMKKYILAGQAQDIWWNVKDLGYLIYYAAEALATGKITGKR
jgi:sorbitol/mannitol transport system substrate-binding protein